MKRVFRFLFPSRPATTTMEQIKALVPAALTNFVSSLSAVQPSDVIKALRDLPTGWKVVAAYTAAWSLFRLRRILNKKDIRGMTKFEGNSIFFNLPRSLW
jgi:hypothetical protein